MRRKARQIKRFLKYIKFVLSQPKPAKTHTLACSDREHVNACPHRSVRTIQKPSESIISILLRTFACIPFRPVIHDLFNICFYLHNFIVCMDTDLYLSTGILLNITALSFPTFICYVFAGKLYFPPVEKCVEYIHKHNLQPLLPASAPQFRVRICPNNSLLLATMRVCDQPAARPWSDTCES